MRNRTLLPFLNVALACLAGATTLGCVRLVVPTRPPEAIAPATVMIRSSVVEDTTGVGLEGHYSTLLVMDAELTRVRLGLLF